MNPLQSVKAKYNNHKHTYSGLFITAITTVDVIIDFLQLIMVDNTQERCVHDFQLLFLCFCWNNTLKKYMPSSMVGVIEKLLQIELPVLSTKYGA